jgi:uroporphyrinogen decarboxylase
VRRLTGHALRGEDPDKITFSVSHITNLKPDHPLLKRTASSPIIQAALGQPVQQVPVWFMRQAGRSLPEYRKLRTGVDMMTACNTTDLIVEITMQPVRRHHVDAAILFSDIVVPLRAAGIDVEIQPGIGPVVAEPVRASSDVARIGELGDVSQIEAAVRILVAELGDKPLIGFCGAPFTLASYLIEGGPSRDHAKTKALMWSEPDVWHDLLSALSRLCSAFLRVQIVAGASAIQVFDSWAGALAKPDYEAFVLPHTRALLGSVADLGVPRIHFGVGTGELLSAMAVPECEVVGVDQRVELTDGIDRIGPAHSVQGNLDPAALFAGRDTVHRRATEIVEAGKAARGHIFNLGHGVLPPTDPSTLTDLVAFLHDM